MYACMFAIGAGTVGAMGLKFGMELEFHPKSVGPHPLGGGGQRVLLEVRAAPTLHFWENFIKQKLQSAPDIEGTRLTGHVRSGPGPHPGVWRPVHV